MRPVLGGHYTIAPFDRWTKLYDRFVSLFRLKGARLSTENDVRAAVDSMLSKPPTIKALYPALAEALTIT